MQDPRIIERVITDTLLLRRLSNTLGAEVDRLLAALMDDLAALIVKHDPSGPKAVRYRADRLAKLLADVEGRVPEAYQAITALVRGGDVARDVAGLAHIGRDHARRSAGHLRLLLGDGKSPLVRDAGLSLNMAKTIVDTEPVHGVLLQDWFRGQARGTSFKVAQQVRLGMARGETNDEIVRRVRGRPVGTRVTDGERQRVYAGGVMQTSTREAQALVRTAVQHVANEAVTRTFAANADIVQQEQFVATLDGRTSDVCRANDGRISRIDDPGRPVPPLHVGCRSIRAPVIKWKSLGLAPPPAGTRASESGQVAADLTYETWLRDQPAARQREILGPGRAKLFREGRINLRDLVREDGGRVRLSELEAMAR